MKVGFLRNIFKSFDKNVDVGVTVKTKDGDQFWQFSHEEIKTFLDPCNKKHRFVSLFSMAVRDPMSEGARFRNTDLQADNVLVSPERAIDALKQYVDIEFEGDTSILKALSQEDYTDIIFGQIHKIIAELVNINNTLCFYAKNRYAVTAKYFIDVETKKAQTLADLEYSFKNTINDAKCLSDEDKKLYCNYVCTFFDQDLLHEIKAQELKAK